MQKEKMPSNPFEVALSTDPHVIVIGESSSKSSRLLPEVASGEVIYESIHSASFGNVALKVDLMHLAATHPAESEVSLRIIKRDPNAMLPASVRRLLKRKRRVRVSFERPVEHALSVIQGAPVHDKK